MEIKFNGKYDRKTFFQAIALVNKPSRRTMIIRYGIFGIFTIIYIIYLFTVATKEDPSTTDVARIGRHLITVALLLYLLLQPYFSAYQAASKIWKMPSVQDPFGGFVTSLGITYNLSSGQKERTWDQFAKIKVTESFVALVTPDGTLSLLQRNFFQSDHDWNTVLQWASVKVAEPV